MSLSIGIYSQLPNGTINSVMERLLSSTLTPLLQHMYRNPDDCFVFSLSGYEMEWIENNHPEINVLINNLARRGQIDFLASSYNGVCIQLLPTNERASEIERSSTFIRRRYSKRASGFWSFQQIFSPSFISTIELCSLSYMVISTTDSYGQKGRKEPFIMSELGKSTIVIPTNDDFSKVISNGYDNRRNTDELLWEIGKTRIDRDSKLDAVMINLDQLLYKEVEGFTVVKAILDRYKSKKVFPELIDINCIRENYILRNGYLNSGSYGFDYRIPEKSIQETILSDRIHCSYYQLIYKIRSIVRNSYADKTAKKEISRAIIRSLGSYSYLMPHDCNSSKNVVEKALFEIKNLMEVYSIPLPVEIDLDNDNFDELVFFMDHYCEIFDSKGGCINATFNDNNANYLKINSRYPLFSDIITTKTKKEISLSNFRFCLDYSLKKDLVVNAELKKFEKEGLILSIAKEFRIDADKFDLTIHITNNGSKSAMFRYSLVFPIKAKGDIPNSKVKEMVFDCNDVIIHCSTDQLAFTVEHNDFYDKVLTPIEACDKYIYTEYRILWDLQIGPNSEITQELNFSKINKTGELL